LTRAAFAPQLIRALRTRRTGDVSLSMLVCVSVGMILWLVHGVRIGDAALVLSNSASLAQAVPLLILKLRNDGWGRCLTFISRGNGRCLSTCAHIGVSNSDRGTPQHVIPAVFKPESRQIKENLDPG